MPIHSAKPAGLQPTVVIVAYDGVKLMDVAGPLQAFHDARQEDGGPAYNTILASDVGGGVKTDAGVVVETIALDRLSVGSVDTLLVAGADLTMAPEATAPLRECLAGWLGSPRRIGSICTGAFVLAQMGVLDGHEATAHWAACDRLQELHPEVIVRPDAIFVRSGRIWTSAGVSAGIDMALAMIEADLGQASALEVARGLVLFLKRPGGQAQFSVELRRQTRDSRGRFDDLHDWIRGNLGTDLSVPALAERAGMSPRNFARVYTRETGESPARAVETLRVETARRMLESGHDPVQVIAQRVGFGDDERMRRGFVKSYGISPRDYRARFGCLVDPI